MLVIFIPSSGREPVTAKHKRKKLTVPHSFLVKDAQDDMAGSIERFKA